MKKLVFLITLLALNHYLFSQEKRLALVIGNSNYEYCNILKNPVNDAFSMKTTLEDLGFEVLEHYNLSQRDMKKAIDDFGLQLESYDVGLFFYAGHGIQYQGVNYLIPVDANLVNERQAEYDCVRANRVLSFMESSGAEVSIVILDACRNNPFARSWDRSVSSKGLAFMDAPSGTLIAYATAPGSTASDGSGKNGLYTSAILESIRIPGITALQMFQNVRSIVSDKSGSQQIPWESTSLIGDFYFSDDTETSISPASYESEHTAIKSRGASSTVINGYYITYKRYGKNKGIYLADDKINRKEFSRILKEADSEDWKDMDKSWANQILFLSGLAGGGAIFLGYGLASEFTSNPENERLYNISAYSGLGIMGLSVLCWWSGYRQYNRVMQHYFPDNYSYFNIGPTRFGFGLAVNF